ncbi:MAG: hypothetical protein Q4G60_01225 [bacterium]|nr:hypothetical protein [bacterium]
MDNKVVKEKQDLTYLKWSHARNSSGTAGTLLKSQFTLDGKKIYYKLSNFDSEKGIIGHESVNEIVVDRLLDILQVSHLEYQLIYADIDVDGRRYATWVCASRDFKEKGESKVALDDYFVVNREENETHYEFCVRNGWQEYIDTMLVIDYLILNRDRHGANIEILRNARKRSIRIAPLFDHGLSLLCSCLTEKEIEDFDIAADKPCQNYIGSRSAFDNLKLVKSPNVFKGKLTESDKENLFADLENALSQTHMDKIWDMIQTRWKYYESICNL